MAPHRILVVDDQAIVREFMEEVPGGAGHEVSSTEGGERALEILKCETFGVMFPARGRLVVTTRCTADHGVRLSKTKAGSPAF